MGVTETPEIETEKKENKKLIIIEHHPLQKGRTDELWGRKGTKTEQFIQGRYTKKRGGRMQIKENGDYCYARTGHASPGHVCHDDTAGVNGV